MALYFVSSSGSNGNAGTQGSPWLTIAYALSNSAAGDTINLNGGNTFTENPSLTSGRTLQSYGTGQATITGGSSANTITITNCSGVTLSNLIITNAQTAEATACVWAYESSGSRYTNGLTIIGCTITGGVQGIVVLAINTNNGGWNGVVIQNNNISGCTGIGIWLSEYPYGSNYLHFSNVLITGNTVHDLPGTTGGPLSGGGAPGSGIILRNADSTTGSNAAQCVISYNLVYNGGQFGTTTSGCAGIFPQNSTGVLIEYNVVHNMYATESGIDGEGIDIDLGNTNTTVQYNYTFNNQGPGYSSFANGTGNVVRWNLSVNDCTANSQSAGSMWFAFSTTNGLSVYNNTIIAQGPNPAVVFISSNETNMLFYNNILVSAAGVPTVYAAGSFTTSDFEGNAYLSGTSSFLNTIGSTNYTSLAAWRSGTGFEASGNGFSGAIGFFSASGPLTGITPSTISQCNNYQLMRSSTLIKAGLNLLSSYGINPGTLDFLGNALMLPYSVGAISPGLNVYRRLLENGSRRELQNLTSYRLLQATSEVSSGTGTVIMMMIVNLACG